MTEVLIYGLIERRPGWADPTEAIEELRTIIQQAVASVQELDITPGQVVVRYIAEDPPAPEHYPLFAEIVLDRKTERTPEVLELMDAAVERVLANAVVLRPYYVRHILAEPRLKK